MDYEIRERLAGELQPNEQLIWCGRPSPGVSLTSYDAFLIPFSLLWGGFAAFWNVMVWRTGAPLVFRLFGLPFLLVGIYMIFGRFVVDAKRNKHTAYALTSQRVLILRKHNDLSSQFIRDIPKETLRVGKTGRGTITFGAGAADKVLRYYGMGMLKGASFAFENIDNCREVYREYQTLKYRLKSGG